MKISKRDIVKYGVEVAISVGVSLVISSAVKQIMPEDVSKLKSVGFKIGAMAISGVITTASARNANQVIDRFCDGLSAGKAARASESQES